MKAWAIRTAIAFVFNGITLWAASILPGVRLGGGFLWVVLVLTAASLLLRGAAAVLFRRLDARQRADETQAPDGGQPARSKAARKALVAAAGLALSLAAVWLTTAFAGGLVITGTAGWVLLTVVVWLASVIFESVDDGLENKAQQLLGGTGPGESEVKE
ncbi:hypothetical protein [Arthrobacter cupressi]|uniref:Uncharacterized protein n=1 Tax=Arthrobacter cupressi TaxID=1045773 RepID=A0A1G8UM02_9MICC|nr:hypothetical protein [Arthrobacter cupressi]NYD76468.1 hypothetical protein [Arthrobacter cupressi]SDJ54936.1 hypothetical protein SAMN05216555_11247 [Arthrobacter cupressi]